MKLLKLMKMSTEARLMELGEKAVAEHALPILKALGLEDDHDGILDKISVSSQIGEDVPNGVFQMKQQSKGFMGRHGVSYVKGSGAITLYPHMFIYEMKNKEMKRMRAVSLIAPFVDEILYQELIKVLAHELRHYWQYSTGIVYKKGDYIGGARFVPYHMRWEEQDANEWSEAYVKGLK